MITLRIKHVEQFKHFFFSIYSKVKFIVIGFSGKPSDSEVHIYTTNSDNQYEAILINEPDASSASTDENTDGEKQKLSSQFMQSFKKVMGKIFTLVYWFGAAFKMKTNIC